MANNLNKEARKGALVLATGARTAGLAVADELPVVVVGAGVFRAWTGAGVC